MIVPKESFQYVAYAISEIFKTLDRPDVKYGIELNPWDWGSKTNANELLLWYELNYLEPYTKFFQIDGNRIFEIKGEQQTLLGPRWICYIIKS